MCYSALIAQNLKNLRIKYQARIQTDMFEATFKNRLEGSGAKIPRALEANFLEKPKDFAEKRIEKYIREFHALEIEKSEKDIITQTKRLQMAEKTLLTKVTKKAQEDQRIASSKIAILRSKIDRIQSEELTEMDSRIYPGMYAPLIFQQKGETVIAPFRYLLRPHGQAPDFDRKYNGAYNARRDSLDRVFWWKSNIGKHHAFMEIKSFWENVSQNAFEGRKLKAGEEEKKIVLRFDPEGLDHMIVPCIYDFNTEGDFPLQSFALITDEPNPEVAAVGHDRTPVIMKEKYCELWNGTGQDHHKTWKDYEIVFEDKQPTFMEHRLSA